MCLHSFISDICQPEQTTERTTTIASTSSLAIKSVHNMAPGVMTSSAPTPSHQLNGHTPNPTPSTSTRLDRKLFPDGLKTSGQHPALPSLLFPYSAFPKHIEGPTVWKADECGENPEKWTHSFTEEEITELSEVADGFIASGRPLTGMAAVSRPNDIPVPICFPPFPPSPDRPTLLRRSVGRTGLVR